MPDESTNNCATTMLSPGPSDRSRADSVMSESHFSECQGFHDIDNTRIDRMQALIYPQLLLEEIPMTTKTKEVVKLGRNDASQIIQGFNDRLIVVVGPCSIHDPTAAMQYAIKLSEAKETFKNDLHILMRVYFEKPRTTVGWKGLINDPDLDESFEVNKGLRIGRKLLADINSLGVPVGCEYLDTMIPQYTADLVSWAAIGARTTECQLHREMASGLSMPVGFKNGTSGDVQMAVDACLSAQHRHAFLGITKQGLPAVCHSKGNPDAHLILRGGTSGTNFDEVNVNKAAANLSKAGCVNAVIVDFSHGNSLKDHKKQMIACDEVCRQVSNGSTNVRGVMIESHLFEGNQSLPPSTFLERMNDGSFLMKKCSEEGRAKSFMMTQDTEVLKGLKYGVSITDKCVNWAETVEMLTKLSEAVKVRRIQARKSVKS